MKVSGNGITLYLLDAVALLQSLPEGSVDLILTDPPWNSGGERKSTQGTYQDAYTLLEYQVLTEAWLCAAWRALKPTGTLLVWLDYRWTPYLAVWGDQLFGYECRLGEIIVESSLGNPGKSRWPVKHSNITIYTKNPNDHYFNADKLPDVERKGGAETRGLYTYGKMKKIGSILPGTFSNTDKERVGYPDQKPVWVLQALIETHAPPGSTVVDPFGGSGSTGVAARWAGCQCILGDQSPQAFRVISERLELE